MSDEIDNTNETLSVISTDNLINIANKAESRIEAVKKIKILSLKVTNHQDWVDQNGKPYLQTSGGEKIARLFGISWTVEEPETRQDGDDGHYMVTYKGLFSLGNASIECIGTRSSKDGFFKKYKDGKELPPSAIDVGDVIKSAFTNLIGNGITRLLGIRNLTYADLAEAGIDVSKITKVEYKKPKPSVSAPQTKQETAEHPKGESDGEDTISEAQAKRFYAIAKGAGWNDADLKKWLMDNYKIDSTKKIVKTIYEHICERVLEDAPKNG